MRFEPLGLPGAWSVSIEPIADERGWFARTFCTDEFAEYGLDPTIAQCNTSYNERRLTLRGMHLQDGPSAEAKLIRCARGRAFDVLVDLRPGSPTVHTWVSVTLAEGDGRAVYAPEGVAHGFLTLTDGCEVTYQMSSPYDPTHLVGVRYDDPAIGIDWPDNPLVISDRDLAFPLLTP